MGTATSNPLVTICCTTYNHAPFIAQTIEGFLAQETDFPVEILVRDDCSTDGTREIVQGLAQRYSERVHAVLEPENTFRKGVKPLPQILPRARGRYLALCEGDDQWTDRTKLARQVQVFERDPQVSLCFHSARKLDLLTGREEIICRHYRADREVPFSALVLGGGHFVPTASMMFRNEAIGELTASYAQAPVGDYFIQVFMGARGKSYYIDRPMALYRRHASGSWSQGFRSIEAQVRHRREMCRAIDRFYPFLSGHPQAGLLADAYMDQATLALLPLGDPVKILTGQWAAARQARHLPRARLASALIRLDLARMGRRLSRLGKGARGGIRRLLSRRLGIGDGD